jgi:hypothetical protein
VQHVTAFQVGHDRRFALKNHARADHRPFPEI